MSDESLESLFSDESEVAQEAPPVETAQEQEAQADAVTGEQEATPPVAEEKPKAEEKTGDFVPKEAVIDERRKRQALEDQLKAMQAEIERIRNPQTEKPKRPDLFEDPDGALSYMEQTFEQKMSQRLADMSVAFAKSQLPDYDEKEAVFVDLVRSDQTGQLLSQLRQAANPAMFAYETAKKVMQFQEMQDVDSYRAKIEAEVRAKIMAEMGKEAKPEAQRNDKGQFISPSLATARAAAPNKEEGTDSLSDLTRLG